MRSYAWLRSAWHQIILGGALFVATLIVLPLQAAAVGSTELITLTNIERTKNGLAPLAYNGQLASSAYAKAQDMLAKGYWAHTAPDGTQPWTFVTQAGYGYITVGENLARDFSTDEAVMAGWMSSAGHRANILKSEYRDIGIAAVNGTMNGESISLVVAHYGATRAAPAARPVASPPATAKPKAASLSPKPAQVQAATVDNTVPVATVPTPPKPIEKTLLEKLLAGLVAMSRSQIKDFVKL